MNPTSLLSGLGAAIGANPSLGGPSAGAPASDTGDLFLALVAGLLGDGADAATQQDDPTADGSATTPDQPPTAEQADPDAPATTSAGVQLTAALAGLVPAFVAGAATTPATPASTAPAAPGVAVDTAASDTAPSGDAPPVDPAVRIASGTTPTTTPVTTPTATSTAPGPTPPAAGEDATAPAAGTSGTTSGTTSAATTGSHTGSTPTSTPTTTAPLAPLAALGVPPVVGAAAPTAATSPTTGARDPGRVTGQVFPEVVRVAGNGAEGGTQRLTIKLNPEALGEVRVVLTHRGGELEVSLAGGEDARRALSEGAPELRRLLEAVGRGDSRIVIRDLPGGTTPAPAPATAPDGASLRSDVSTDLGGDARSGAGRSGEPAAEQAAASPHTPGSTNATDGSPSATVPSRVSTTSSSGRLGGLDVSI